tara:strand:+ start:507 stop:722 length:216 start_codon:yes stop_codon:yes gene_type:complete
LHSVGFTDDKSNLGKQYDAINSVWNEIGQIEDIVLSQNGQTVRIVCEVGGFREIGDKLLMISVPVVAVPAL